MIGAYDWLMRVLCVCPSFPKTYWGAELSLALTGKKSMLPPLGLLTVAALLPPSWPVRLAGLNLRPLDPAALESMQLGGLAGITALTMGLGKETNGQANVAITANYRPVVGPTERT